MITVPMEVAVSEQAIPMELGVSFIEIEGEHYNGDYTVTPTDQTQTLQTANKVMDYNVTVNPIPNNYGRITWTGSVITVS